MTDLLPFVRLPSDVVMGIDPGINGAIAFLDTQSWELGVIDMPLVTKRVAGEDRREPAVAAIAALTRAVKPILICCERMQNFGFHPNPDDLMKLGRWRGHFEMLAAALEIGFEDPTPSVWKHRMGVNANKALSRNRAAKLFPDCVDLFARVKDHDRAEAAMLALYGCIAIARAPTKPIGRIETIAPPAPQRRRPKEA